ncbi:MAG: hypothetical protein ABSF90_24125 [Syntrophobacteraceae bacterium]|jgi:hypothetical protein
MAEIKSTLDLVMERTRHLRMTEEDKRKQAAAAFKEAVSRLARKYLDGQISLDKLQAELNQLEGGASGREEAAAEIGRRIDPYADNTLLLDLIKNGLGFDISRIEAILHHFRETVHSEEDQAVERVRADLLKKGISGSAVMPSLETDKDWARRRKEMLETVRVELDARIAQLKQHP